MGKKPPIIIGVGGAGSGVGKTTVACSILRALEGWGAIKYTKTLLNSVLIDDKGVLAKQGKDTALMLESGAERVIWIRSPRFRLRGILLEAILRLSDLEGIVVEGNSAVSILEPDIVVFVADEGNLKKGSEKILTMADIVLYAERAPEGSKEKARLLQRDDAGFRQHLLSLIAGIKAKKPQPPT